MADVIQMSVVRIAGLIDDVMDFARGQLGSGFTLDLTANAPLAPVLHQVIGELRTSFPDRAIEAEIGFDNPIHCDPKRIAQLLSNLLDNALTYGATDMPIRVSTATKGPIFELSVANAGDPSPVVRCGQALLL
jgi:sigma-B regulation protein RsbU (phosphoserine phosphatase)